MARHRFPEKGGLLCPKAAVAGKSGGYIFSEKRFPATAVTGSLSQGLAAYTRVRSAVAGQPHEKECARSDTHFRASWTAGGAAPLPARAAAGPSASVATLEMPPPGPAQQLELDSPAELC